jgi:hypothetical protein
MHPALTEQLAAERIADLHRQATRQRLLRELRARPRQAARRRRVAWPRLWWRLRRPAAA